jgi:DNA-binding MarR family transcriptional regulator
VAALTIIAWATTSSCVTDIYTADTYHPRKGFGYLLNRLRAEIMMALDRELATDEELAALELSSAQFMVISKIATSEEVITASQLCKGISYDAGAMTRMLDRLEAKGLIRRQRSADDRRAVYLELTDAGRAAYPRMRLRSMSVQNRFLKGISQDELRQLESLLTRVLGNA